MITTYFQIWLRLINQLSGFTIAITSLPLWAVAAAVAYIQNPAQLTTNRTLVGNSYVSGRRIHSPFQSFEFNCTPRLLRNLPLLCSVASGKLHWCGVSILSPDMLEARTETWAKVRDKFPVGLVGPALLEVGPLDHTINTASIELDSRIMADATYADSHWLKLIYSAVSQWLQSDASRNSKSA